MSQKSMAVGVEERQKVASSARERDTLFESSKSDESIFFIDRADLCVGVWGSFYPLCGTRQAEIKNVNWY